MGEKKKFDLFDSCIDFDYSKGLIDYGLQLPNNDEIQNNFFKLIFVNGNSESFLNLTF